MLERICLFLARLDRAWSYYRKLHYSWRLAWVKAGYSSGNL